MLLGLPGDNTYANYAEANRGFWRQTVLPLVSRTAGSLAHWLAPAWGGALRLEPDLDRIDALAGAAAAAQIQPASVNPRMTVRYEGQ
jgi:phage portal protein BeeE